MCRAEHEWEAYDHILTRGCVSCHGYQPSESTCQDSVSLDASLRHGFISISGVWVAIGRVALTHRVNLKLGAAAAAVEYSPLFLTL